MKSELEYEYIIKSLIDPNIRECYGMEIEPNHRLFMLRYGDKEFEFKFHFQTNYQVVLDYFYQQIMSQKVNKVSPGFMGEDC